MPLSLRSARPARADEDRPPIRLRLVYEPTEEAQICPAAPAVLEVFRARLATGTIDPDAPASARVTVHPRPRGILQGRVALVDGEGHQLWTNELQARFNDCRTLIASLALSLRVALDAFNRPPPTAAKPGKAEAPSAPGNDTPIRVRATSELPPAPVLAAGFRPRDPYHPAAPASESTDIGAPANFRLWASAALSAGIVPTIAPRFSLSMGLYWPSGSFSFEARGVPPVDVHIDTYKVVIARWEGVFLPCATREALFGCVTVAAGTLWSEASQTSEASHVASEIRTRLHVALGVRIGLDLAITSHLAALVFLDIEAALLPATVVLQRILWDQPVTQASMGIAFGRTFQGALR